MGIDPAGFAREFPGGSPQANQAVRNLVRLADVIVDAINLRLRTHGLHLAAAQALGVLEGAPEPLTPNEINAHLHLTSGTVTTLLDGLERKGLVERRPHPSDRRKVLITITDQGRRLVDKFLPETVAIQTALLAGLTQAQLTELNRLAERGLASANDIDPDAVAASAPPRWSGRR